ncbi:hypothetical protein A2U01_0111645, partial [Trifolium medium]|nr:hypothetical protein [Trifolium medium]
MTRLSDTYIVPSQAYDNKLSKFSSRSGPALRIARPASGFYFSVTINLDCE